MIKRREFIAGLGGTAVAWPLAARAQQLVLPVVGFVSPASEIAPLTNAFREGLREQGYVEAQNVLIEYRYARGAFERLPGLAAELAALRPAVMVGIATAGARAAIAASANATPNIPVVFVTALDPVQSGLVASLSRPGGNATGVTSMAGGLSPKRLDLAREFLRGDDGVAILINPGNPLAAAERNEVETAARAIGRRLEVITATNEIEIEKAFAGLEQRRVGVLLIASDTFFFSQMQRFATLSSQHAVPVVGPLREFTAEGGLMSYGTSIPEVNRQCGVLVGKILKGARPADLPVLRPTKFELVLNLKTAERLGIMISPKLLALADEIIE